MAGFSYQYSPFLLDSIILPNTPMTMPGLLEEGDTHTTCFSHYPSEPFHEVSIDVRVHNEICPDNSTRVSPCHNEPSIIEKQQNTDSSSVVIEREISDQVTQKKTHLEKKKKNRSGSCSISAQSKDANEGKFKKQKKCSSTFKDTEKKQLKAEKKKVDEGTPTAYIHVRARRGQATDSHSLAERVRREKINDRMKLLQGLVPGCDKVTSKVLKLDEIINYIQSLHNQVEFLSMKLASVNPMFYDFGVDLDAFMKPSSFASPSPSVQVCSPAQPTILAENTTTFATTNNYPTLDTSLAMLVQQGQRPNAFSQENGNILWNVEDHRQRLINQSGFNNFCSFQ